MVRFHSSYNDRGPDRRSDSLGRSFSTRRSSPWQRQQSPNRRLFRLVLALGLVLIVMQRTGDPKIYRMFFPGLQETVTVQDDLVWQPTYDRSSRSDSKDDTTQPTAGIDDSDDQKPQADQGTSPDDQTARAQAARATADPSTEAKEADRRMLDAVDDRAIWVQADQPAFFRLLQTGGRPAHLDDPAMQVGCLSLLNQPDVYLKTKVLVIGRLGRIERIESKANEQGIKEYYQLWIDPNDASQRPVTCYCLRLLPTLEPYLGLQTIPSGPLVHVEGVYLKRLAYASPSGSQLAPAIVGRITAGPAPLAAQSSTAAIGRGRGQAEAWGMWLVGIPAIAALVVTIVIYRASALAGRRIRQARQQAEQLDPSSIQQLQAATSVHPIPVSNEQSS